MLETSYFSEKDPSAQTCSCVCVLFQLQSQAKFFLLDWFGKGSFKHDASNQENHMKDIMEAVEKVKCGKSFLNTLTSKQLRLGFYGMFRKSPFSPLDSCLT